MLGRHTHNGSSHGLVLKGGQHNSTKLGVNNSEKDLIN